MRLLVAIVVLATLASADDSAGVCARSCVLGGTDAMYEAGMQYHYQYQGEVRSTAVVAGQDKSRLAFSAEVVITANTPCDLKLMVANLVVENVSDDAKWFSEAVQEHDLHFSYQHGTITHLCPHVEEEAIATNFKRGILSALQMSVSTKNHSNVVVSEVDVLGECETKYSVVLEPSLEVTKTKMGCHISSYIPHLPHSQYTNIKANAQLPFVKSNQVCKMQGSGGRTVRGDIDAIGGGGEAWQKVECKDEVEVRRPLMPGGDALASVTVSSTLTLDQGPSPVDGIFSKDDKSKKRVSLVANLKAAVEFAEKKKIQASGMREQLDSVLGSLLASESPDGEDTRPRLFSSLVHLLGYLEEEELEALWDASRTQRIRRKVLLDGLLVCDAGPCHGLVAQLASEEGVLSPGQVNSWLTGLHLHSSSHPSVITQLLNLAKSQKQATVAAVMAASSMVHRLCQQQPAECPSLAQPFLEYVDQNVGDSCGLGKSKQQQEHVKLVLRAMGNAGVLPTDHFPERCYLNKALSPELRITALQSYRRSGCTDTKGPWQLLEDGSERSEVRIAAYLALVPCIGHTSSFFSYIHNFLQHEKVHQVYSFIWTHVKNLADHPGPSSYDQTLSKLFRQYTLPQKLNSDAFRSSGNFRYAQFSEMLNLGGSLDANVVYSKDSYMPRQVSANLTLDVLDNSFNFLDFGLEFSGIENIIESYFGKDGYFGNEDILKVLQSLRPKRNIIHDDKIQEFQKIYNEAKDKKKLATDDDMGEEEAKASFYVRMFGNEVLYVENFLQYSSAQLLYHLIQEISSPKIFKIIDQEYMAPTLLGFPLRLRLNATASVSLQHHHTFQNTQTSGLLLEGSIVPTLVAAMDETLLVDAFVSCSGFRRSSTQVAKTSIGGKFSYQDGEVTELHVSVPSEEVTRVSSSVKVALLKGVGRWEEPEGISTEEKDHCINAIEEVVGLKMCTSHRYSTYEVAGELVNVEPYKTEFKVAKTDSFTYYKLYIKWQDNIVEALFDTPGSSVDRKIHFLFHMNPDHESGYVVVRGVGYGIKGQYNNSEATQELQLQYLQASEVLGELEVSLHRQGNSSQEYVPKFQLAIGSNKFSLEGKFKHNTNEDAKKVEVSWELEGMWHKQQLDMVMQAFGTASGSFTAGPDGFNLHLSTEYGNDRSQPHTITLNLGGTHSLRRDMQITIGHASLQISQAPTGLTVEYELRPDLFELSINTSLQDTQVSSQVVLKNMMEGGSWDTQLTLILASQQLNLDYKVSGIYRVSESGFQAEVELNLGDSLKSKFLLTYLFEDNPMHMLAGLHLIFNDFVFQIVHSIDMSQPDHLLITISSIVGEGTAGLHLEADYEAERPLNILLKLYAGLGIHSISLAFHTTSDPLWHTFTGKSTIKWLDWSESLAHEITLNETTRAFKLSLGTSKSVEFYSETSPNQTVKVVVKDGLVDSIPIFLMGAERHITSDRSQLQVNLTAGGSHLMYLAWHMDSENKFTLDVRILESELSMKGQYSVIDNGTVSGASQVKIMLPTGDTVSSNLSLSYTMAENERLLSMLASHDGSVIEAQLLVSLCSHDTEKAGVNFTLTTPHPDLQKFGFNFHKSGGAHSLYSAGIQLDSFKILGEAQLSDPSNLTVKLEYEGGEECATRLHLEHRHSEQQYFSLASLAPTQASEPWELMLNISHDHSKHRKFLDTMLNAHAPVMPTPFHFHGKYDVTQDQVQLEIQAGLKESISVLYSGKKELSWKRHLLHGLGKIEASWMEPLAINVTYDHTLGHISIYVDFQSPEEYMSPWSTEFSSEYSSLEDIKASFYLTHPEFQVIMELVHNQSKNSWKQQLDGSINTFTITYNTNLRWNEYLVPIEADGSLSLFNFLDHSLDLSLSHSENSSTYRTQVTGTLDDYNIGLEHQLGLIQAEGSWQDFLQISLRDIGATTGGISLTTYTIVDWPAINASLKFESPWTDSFGATFMVQEMNLTTIFKLDSLYNDESVLSIHIMCGRWPSWDYSDIDLQVKSVFEDFNMKLQHDFNSGNLVIGKMSYGSDVDVQFGSHLKMKETWFEQEFLSYAFNVSASLSQLNINLKGIATVDSHLNGTLELHWNEDSLSVNSSVLSGNIFEAKLRNSGTNYQSGLKYKFEGNILFSINFTLLRDGESLVNFSIVVGSIHSKLYATSTLELYYNTDSKSQSTVLVTADLTNLDKYSLQGSLQLKSNLLASKEYGGQLDFDMNFHDELKWKCAVGIAVLGGEWDIKSGINSSLEVSQALNFEFGARLHILYGNETFDVKDVNVVLTAESDTAYEMRMILQLSHTGAPWSLAIIYNPRFRTLKGFLSLGDPSKYELSLRLSTKTLSVDVHRVNEDDSKWQIVEGNINWIIKRTKQLVTMNMKSDIAFISKITGKIIVQKKRDVAVTATLKVNDDQFLGNFRLSTPEPGKSFRLDIKIDNSIVQAFESEVTLEFFYIQSGFTYTVKVGLNQEPDWIEGNLKFSVPESYIKLKTPFSFLETFNATIRIEISEDYGIEIVFETPQFCCNLTGNMDKNFLYASLNLSLDVPCNGNSMVDFKIQYMIGKSPAGILCELNIFEYRPLFKFNATGILTLEETILRIETKAYPQHTFGLSLACQVGEQYNLMLLVDDSSSNETYFTFEILLSPLKAELTIKLPEEQSLLLKANYDFKNQSLRFRSNLTSSLFNYELNAKMAAEATLGEEGNIEIIFTSNTAFTHLNISTTYSFLEELKDISFKILTPSGDADVEIRVLKDKDFYTVKADMTSSIHSFHKYHLEVRQTVEDNMEKLIAMLSQDDIEYHLSGSKKITENGTEGSLNVSLPFENYEHFSLDYIQQNGFSGERQQVKLNVKSHDTMYTVEARHDPVNALYELLLNRTASGSEYVCTIRYSAHSSGSQIEIVLNIPELEERSVSVLLKYDPEGLGSAVFYSPYGQLGVESSWTVAANNVTVSGTAYLTLFDLGEYNLDMNIPLQLSERAEIRIMCIFPDQKIEMWLSTAQYFKTMGGSLSVRKGELEKAYSLTYDLRETLKLEGKFDKWNLETTWILNGTQAPASSGHFQVRSNLPGYEVIDGSWEVGHKNWEYFGKATLDMKHQEVLSVSATLDTLSEAVYQPWQSVRLNMLLESPFTLPHHLHAEYQLLAPRLLLYYQHGLDTFKMQLISNFESNAARLTLTGNVPVTGVSTFEINFAYNFLESYSASVVVKVEDSTLEHKFDFSSDWRVGSLQMVLTSPFLKPGKAHLSWSLVPNSVNLKGFFNVGELSAKVKMSLENTKSSADFDCHITTSLEELSQFIVSLSYRVSGNRNFDASFAARVNNNGLLMKSSSDTKGKLLLKFQGTFEILENRGSLEVDVGTTWNGYSGTVVGIFPGYKKFSVDLYCDSYLLKLDCLYDSEEVFIVSITYSQIKVLLYWTEYWSFNLETQHHSKGGKLLFHLIFSGFGGDPIEMKASYSQRPNPQVELSLATSLLPPSALHITYLSNKVTARATVGDKIYLMTGQATFGKLQSSFDIHFGSSDEPNDSIVVQVEYDFTDFFRGKMKTAKKLTQITLEWGGKTQVNVTGLRSGFTATIDLKMETPLESLPHLHLGFHGEFFFTESFGFNCTAFAEWSERLELTAIAKLTQATVHVESILTTSFPFLEKLSTFAKLEPGQLKFIAQYNADTWKAVWAYQFTPFSITCTLETPIKNFEKISLSVSLNTDNGKFGAQFELMWTDQSVGVQIEVEKWQVDVNFQTPWEPFTSGMFTALLKTESEKLTFSSALKLNKQEAEVDVIILSTDIKFHASYHEDSVTVGLAKLEHLQRDDGVRISLEVQTPCKNVEVLEMSLQYGNNKFSLMFKINEVVSIIEGLYSANGGNFKVTIPLLSNFTWSLKSENSWLKAETNVIFNIAETSEPQMASFNYNIGPSFSTFRSVLKVVNHKYSLSVDVKYDHGITFMARFMKYSLALEVNLLGERNSMKIKIEAPDLGLESLEVDGALEGDYDPYRLDTNLTVLVKHQGEEPHLYKIEGVLAIEEYHLAAVGKIGGNGISTYEISIKIPLNFLGLEIILTGGGTELFALQYSSGSQHDWFLPQKFVIQAPAWEAKGHLLLTSTSLTASLTLPQPSREHSLTVKWPKQFTFQDLQISAELKSPYIHQDNIQIAFTCKVPENFTGKMELSIVFGDENMHVNGEYYYDNDGRTFNAKFQVASNWISNYFLEASVQWRSGILVSASLEALDEEHSVRLHIDVANSAIELKLKSTYLPAKEITFTGKINNPLDLSHLTLTSKLQADDQNVHLEARVDNDQMNNVNVFVVLKQNSQDIFYLSLEMYEDLNRTDIGLSVQLLLKQLKNSIHVRYYNSDWGRYFSGNLDSYMLTEQVQLIVINSHELRSLQSLKLSGPDFQFHVESHVSEGKGIINTKLGYEEIYLSVSGDIFREKQFGIRMETTFVSYEVLSLYAKWSDPDRREAEVEYARNGDTIRLYGNILADDIFGYSVHAMLITTFEGYEKFSVYTPRHKSGKYSKALLEYPGRKVGVDINLDFQNIFLSDFTISLYLPYEQFDIVSVKYIVQPLEHFEIEARIGKIGLTLSSFSVPLSSGMLLETIVRVNEESGKSVLYLAHARTKRMLARYSFVFEPKELTEHHSFHLKGFYEVDDRVFFLAKTNMDELVKVHLAWGADKIFSVITPKFLPSYIHTNFECSSLRNDYHIEFGHLAYSGIWSVFGLQLHQEVLPGGHHLSLLGRSGKNLVSIAGTLSATPYHFNNSLVFLLNKNKLGYKMLLLSEPGILSRSYTSDVQLLLHNRTLHHYTHAETAVKSLHLISDFTWNKMDIHMPSITFSVNYDDRFIFGNGKKYLRAVLSHPDIKDITLQANITRTHNSSLSGSAELIDGNSPDMKVVATVVVEPVNEDGRKTVSLSLSQPVSSFSMLVEGQLRQSPFNEALCHLKYYNLTSETWHQLNVSASLEAEGSSHILTVAAVAPEREWGHTWMGVLDFGSEVTSLNVEGSSRGTGDTWRLGTVIKRHLPELHAYLSVGKEQEVYEKTRVRLGLHNPVEAGVALDHLRFGQWHQDAALGLRLASPHILQAFVEFNPSMNYEDPYEWAQLFSSAAEVLDVWERDMAAAKQTLEQLATAEVPAAVGLLLSSGTIQAIWQREASNWEYFLKDVEDSYLKSAEDVRALWENVLVPIFNYVKDHTFRMYEEALNYLATLKDSIQHHLEGILQWLQQAWHSLKTKAALQEAALRMWLAKGLVILDQEASVIWIDLLHWITGFGEKLRTSVTSLLERAKGYFISLGEMVEGYLSNTFQAIQPCYEQLLQTLESYHKEVLAEFSGPCWMAIADKKANLAVLSQNLDDSARVVIEFLQGEKLYALLLQASDWMEEKTWTVWSSIEEAMTKAGQNLPQVLNSWSPYLSETISQLWDTLSGLSTQVFAQGLYSWVASMTDDLQEKVAHVVSQLSVLLRENTEQVHSHLVQFSAFGYIDVAMRGIYHWAQSAWQSWSLGKHTDLDFLEQTLFLGANAVRNYFVSTNYLLNHIYVFEPGMLGHILYNQYLPIHWASFMELPHWAFPSRLFQTESAATEAERLLAAALPNPSLEQAITPSYTATAIIAGQHVTTFDLQHYQFLGSCTYLLAKDFEGGDFEAFGVYEVEAGATRLKTVVVHGPNIDVALNVDGNVTVRGTTTKLYYNSTEYSALKLPDLFVSCSRALRGCALTVSSKYFGRLGGLLGNYNGEASDDLHGPSGQMVQDVAQLATLWAISPTPCYQANQASMVEYSDVDEEDVRECSQLFLYRSSLFSSCFHALDPHPYFTHCIKGSTHPAFSEHDLNSPCTAVSSYHTQCWARGIHLPYLDKCQNGSSTGCVVEGREVPYGWSQVYEETSHGSADVAIIVELASCNAGKKMNALLEHLSRQLERKNINDAHYSVVTVGEYSTTTRSFFNKTDAEDFLNTLIFSGSTVMDRIETAVTSTASQIQWRPGVSRSIVHVGCQVCEHGDEATKALHQNDVTYHLVSSLRVEMAGTKEEAQARTRKMFGFDKNLVYIPADFKNFRGNEKLRLALRGPKGGCVATALSTGGSVFDSDKWTPRKEIQARKFLSVLGERIAVSSLPPKCQECHCLKGNQLMWPTCFKCFGNSAFLITQADSVAEDSMPDTSSVTKDIKRSFQVFLETNRNSTNMRIL